MDELDKIGAEAAQLETEQTAQLEAIENPDAQPPIDPAQAWATIPKMFGGILSMALPELEKAYSDERCYAWGGAMVAVADKYGWDAAETMAKWGPEIALTMATLPLAIPTVKAIKKALDEEKKEKPIEGPELVKQVENEAGNVAQ